MPRTAGAALVCLAAWHGPLAACHAADEVAGPPPAAATASDKELEPISQRLKLSTSDGVALAAWYYPAAQAEPAEPGADAPPLPASVILLHGLDGSHTTVEPLAHALQARGIAVVAPDLRGHGASTGPGGRATDAKSLKKEDFTSMAVAGGGRVREQADVRGDVEAVRNWIKERSDAGVLDVDKLVVVGCGTGAAVAAQWTVLDAKWPDIANGPQGRNVRGLVLVSPAWTTNGFSISPALAAEPVRRSVPILVIGGARDDDAVKIYDQLKRQRPEGWSEKRAGQAAATQAPKLADDTLPTLYLRQFDTPLSGDRLAAFVPTDRRAGGHAATIIEAFVGAVTTVEP